MGKRFAWSLSALLVVACSRAPDAAGPDTQAALGDAGPAATPDAADDVDATPGAADSGDGASASCGGAGCVRPTACNGGDPPAVFRRQDGPPSALAPAAPVSVSVTFANCSGATWRGSVTKLGAQSPTDNDRWGAARIDLPADVPSGSEVTVAFTAHASPLVGKVQFAWQVWDDTTGTWIGQASPALDVDIVAPPATVTLCGGRTADASGASAAAAAIQGCIDATPDGGTLDLPAGLYRIDAQLHVTRSITLRTAGLGGAASNCFTPGVRCATFQADPQLYARLGIITLGTDAQPVHDVALDHILIDGNRGLRTSSVAAVHCTFGDNVYGMNATAQCSHCTIAHSASVRALCGTAMGFQGALPTITGSDFRENGQHAPTTLHQFADGLTLSHGDGAIVTFNVFRDNSDIGFVTGGSRTATLSNNVIVQREQAAFAGLMLDNFNGTSSGDFTGASITGNTIDCGAHLCDYGIELGPHPWYASSSVFGGVVQGNVVKTAAQGINAAGAGTAAAPMAVWGNTVSGSAATGTFTCGVRSTSPFNITSDSVIDRNGETSAVTTQSFDGCQ